MKYKEEKYIVGKTLISAREIKKRVKDMAREIDAEYARKKLFIIVLLKGSFVFAADLLRSLKVDSNIYFIRIQSYASSTKQQGLVWHMKITDDVRGRDILLIDDIYDSGKTMKKSVKYLKTFNPTSVKTCALLKKKRKRAKSAVSQPDYAGFEVPDVFVVGYGLDFAGKYRNLPYIAEVIKK